MWYKPTETDSTRLSRARPCNIRPLPYIQETYIYPSTAHAPAGAQPRLPQTTAPSATAPKPPASPAPTLPRPAPPSTSSPPPRSTPTLPLPEPVVDLDDDPHLLISVERYTYKDWAGEQPAEPVCCAAICFPSLDSPSPPSTDLLNSVPSAQRPQLSDVGALAAKSRLHRTDDETAFWYNDRPHPNPGTNYHRPPPIPRASTSQC